jgi:hypothetical protein
MKMGFIGVGLVAAMTLGAVSAKAVEVDGAKKGWEIAGVRIANPLDSMTWWDGSTDLGLDKAPTVAINFADPDFWMALPEPGTHSLMHKSFVNPVTWAQFFKVDTYTAMMDVDVWKKWGKLETYAVLADPETYTYRLQPGAFMHAFDARSYAQLVNPAAYKVIFDTMAETANLQSFVEMGKEVMTSATE